MPPHPVTGVIPEVLVLLLVTTLHQGIERVVVEVVVVTLLRIPILTRDAAAAIRAFIFTRRQPARLLIRDTFVDHRRIRQAIRAIPVLIPCCEAAAASINRACILTLHQPVNGLGEGEAVGEGVNAFAAIKLVRQAIRALFGGMVGTHFRPIIDVIKDAFAYPRRIRQFAIWRTVRLVVASCTRCDAVTSGAGEAWRVETQWRRAQGKLDRG